MQKKIRISEFEKELKKIDENVQVTKSITGYRRDYNIKFNSLDGYLCAFNLGTLDGLKLYYHNTYDKFKSDVVLNKAIELIPHLVPDDYKEPTIEEIFEEFEEEVEENGFYLRDIPLSRQTLKFYSCDGTDWWIASFNRNFENISIALSGEAPIDKFIEGLELLIKYVKKARSLRHIKLYEIPLPGLKATDGEKQYLSTKNGYYFTCRKNNELKQTWTEKELINVPKAYREYAVEVEDEGC